LLAAIPHVPLVAPPPQFAVVPKNLNMEGNDTYGDCVSAEEAFAKAWYSVYCGLPELLPSAAETVSFANKYGYLNGANLTDVMDTMIADGMVIGGKTYKDGPYSGVNYTDATTLNSALTVGCVKIAIDADALPQGAGNANGWYSTSGQKYTNTDHCVSVAGFGAAGYLFDQLQMSLPSGLSSSTPGLLVYTWATIGFVVYDWINGTCAEAWVRNPTTVGQAPTPTPVPPIPVPPTPVPPGPAPAVLAIAALGESLAFGKWSNGMNVGSTCQVTGTAKINALQGVPTHPALASANAPYVIILLVYLFESKLLPIVLADLQAGKTWMQIGQDILVALLGPQANTVARK
jgi:hypothetical protein